MIKILSFGRSCKAYLRLYQDHGQAIANFRYGLIASLSRKLKAGEQMALLREIAGHVYTYPNGQEKKIGIRTLERYLHDYRSGGWDALLRHRERTSYSPLKFQTMSCKKRFI